MLLNYDKQLVTARRLARYRRSLMAGREDQLPEIPHEVKRRQLVERVAREVIENLIIVGGENPVVDDIKLSLEKEFQEDFYFEYPLTGQDLQIFRETPEGPQEIVDDEKMHILGRLWSLTLDKVDETML